MVERFEDARRRREIHVGDPEREHVSACVAFPFLAAGIPAVDDMVEIEWHRTEEARHGREGNGGVGDDVERRGSGVERWETSGGAV
jgi:hypothetical protein